MMLPALSEFDYARVWAAVDVNLDSFPSGGHAASMDAPAAFTPTMTLPLALLAGRGAQAFLAALRLPHLIARIVPEYVPIALARGTNGTFQHEQHVALQQRVPRLRNASSQTPPACRPGHGCWGCEFVAIPSPLRLFSRHLLRTTE